MIDHEAVREANIAFYRAFENLNIQEMDTIWADEDYVRCIHPGWDARIGWNAVRDSWVLIFNNTFGIQFSVEIIDMMVRAHFASVACIETIATLDQGTWQSGMVVATNLFEERHGMWKIIHHHGSPVIGGHLNQETK